MDCAELSALCSARALALQKVTHQPRIGLLVTHNSLFTIHAKPHQRFVLRELSR